MFKSIFIVTLALFITACGGGNSEESSPTTTPTNPNKIFDLSELHSITQGTVYTSQLTGIDSNGTNYTGSISLANRPQEMYNGVLVTPRDLLLNLSNGSTSTTVTGTSYVDNSNYLLAYTIQTSGLTCTPVSPDKIPTSVMIDDFGILPTLTCNDGTTTISNWRAEDAGNGNIKIVSNETTRDSSNVIKSSGDVIFTINGNGNIIGFKTNVTLSPSNFTLTYSSL
jgi:hypothetical protein